MKRPHRPLARASRQRGVAVITALLLTTLAVTIVASLFWQQQVQVRSMENQRLHLQTKWIMRGALDWTRLILRQDGQDHPFWTSDQDVWATPLAETRLDDYVERERVEGEKFDATLSGQIIDAQSRYNLANLATNRAVNQGQRMVFSRLLQNQQLDPSLAQAVADEVARSQSLQAPLVTPAGKEPMAPLRVEDLLALPGFTPQSVERLRELVIVLPQPTAINLNTASAELLAALVDNFSLAEASVVVSARKRAICKNTSDFQALLGQHVLRAKVDVSCKSDYFLVRSRVRLDRAALDAEALIWRQPAGLKTDVQWIREY
ncbi:type II secretion system minor pseudopilin GspK [Rugamonas sp. CCM 8940]|uniref:type II secretion system minor pseudopilin GspK n=1 Tax=Rugamonas sp. CCM 8940 TaxID=2765359 RepID=UPI0018F6F977|nr:type II secretion system minor pseudopilin GspK [Rugamonas sp. CCM 8940]MBJ7310085.1 type II secretion system minor pseudopilin GspK [Rugamonas sp. CCM 8940]